MCRRWFGVLSDEKEAKKMSTLDRSQRIPQYPVYNESAFGFQRQTWAPDMRPSGLGPGYSVYASTFGRNLAGVGDNMEGSFSGSSEGIEVYPNEVEALSVADDVVGNGVFDPNGSHGNVHPDAGVFQDHASLPGYVARDRFFERSEVKDLTQPDAEVVYVPGGAVSFQQGQQQTYAQNQLLWELPRNMNPFPMENLPSESIVNAPTATNPVGQTPESSENPHKWYYVAAGVGVVAGISWVLFFKNKKGRK